MIHGYYPGSMQAEPRLVDDQVVDEAGVLSTLRRDHPLVVKKPPQNPTPAEG